jgi:site-specific DNA recombinase
VHLLWVIIMGKTALRLYTSYYANKDLAASGLVCVGITRFPPRFPLAFTLKTNLVDLAPSAALLSQARSGTLSAKQFEIRYIAQLERVGIKTILTTLRRLQGRRAGVALLCFERAGTPCHRRTLAAWLQRKGGLTVDEFDGSTLLHDIEEEITAARAVAIGYCRISKAGDARSVSIATQKAQIAAYATSQGWRLAATLEDNGVSGGRRSRFDAIDAALKQHRATALIVFALDRAGRDVVGLLGWLERAKRSGIQLHVCGRGLIEATTSSGFLGTSIEAVVSQHYRLIVAEKTRSALAHLRERGRRWANQAPYGTRWTADGGAEVEPWEQGIIARARALRGAGLSLRMISVILASEGKVARSGGPLSSETLNSILRRPS